MADRNIMKDQALHPRMELLTQVSILLEVLRNPPEGLLCICTVLTKLLLPARDIHYYSRKSDKAKNIVIYQRYKCVNCRAYTSIDGSPGSIFSVKKAF